VRTVPLDPDIRERATVLAALAHARALTAEGVNAALGLEPPLGDDADPRWYTRADVVAALGGSLIPDGVPLRVAIDLWPHQAALLTAGDLPAGVLVVLRPDGDRCFRRTAPFPGLPASAASRAASSVPSGPEPDPRPGDRAGGSVAESLRPLELVADLGASRFAWAGVLAADTTQGVLAAAAEARARRHGDVEVLEKASRQDASGVRLMLAVRLHGVSATTPVAGLVATGDDVLAAVWAPVRELNAEVTAVVAAARIRIASLALTSGRA
jgi:hypothetical protein